MTIRLRYTNMPIVFHNLTRSRFLYALVFAADDAYIHLQPVALINELFINSFVQHGKEFQRCSQTTECLLSIRYPSFSDKYGSTLSWECIDDIKTEVM